MTLTPGADLGAGQDADRYSISSPAVGYRRKVPRPCCAVHESGSGRSRRFRHLAHVCF
jgi:hypothetical protein